MKYAYKPIGICPSKIELEIENDILKSVAFFGGCNGNLQAISKLVEGMPISEVKEKLSGIRCGHKSTSCADQLVKGIEEALSTARA